ncbi:FAD-dependent oxidoreductase [Granulicella sp. WH15]|uniref:NAD(P)/FAD-dependent oxidoreductase n=1 Tax=Granulicella sp. WH15 TaxID=2602070 RepID=UPI001366F0C8|nr:FAD-dependent oxidoreductase [Granulicella sp. WH15]QHN04893.1 FAD-dependent oxidoreductase [Granulicella sp. WH15]
MADIVIAGAGIIGLSLALELERRGARVTVLEAGKALAQASTAAGGMLAAEDPGNPAALLELSRHSISLYPEFLDRLESLSGERIPFQTSYTLQALESPTEALDDARRIVPWLVTGEHRFQLLDEHSIDPRQLAEVLLAAVRASSIELLEENAMTRLASTPDGVRMETASGQTVAGDYLVDCMGAWSPAPVTPVKGQMLAVALPAELPLEAVVRTHDTYIIPRLTGPNAGRVVIGATVENAGYDKTVKPHDILALHARASALLPQLKDAHFVESWAGLRPSTADGLPILGTTAKQTRYMLANGHYRNGILLAPATAQVVADMLERRTPAVDLKVFRPERFQPA